jgi:hypothetical protein
MITELEACPVRKDEVPTSWRSRVRLDNVLGSGIDIEANVSQPKLYLRLRCLKSTPKLMLRLRLLQSTPSSSSGSACQIPSRLVESSVKSTGTGTNKSMKRTGHTRCRNKIWRFVYPRTGEVQLKGPCLGGSCAGCRRNFSKTGWVGELEEGFR